MHRKITRFARAGSVRLSSEQTATRQHSSSLSRSSQRDSTKTVRGRLQPAAAGQKVRMIHSVNWTPALLEITEVGAGEQRLEYILSRPPALAGGGTSVHLARKIDRVLFLHESSGLPDRSFPVRTPLRLAIMRHFASTAASSSMQFQCRHFFRCSSRLLCQ